MISIIVAIDEQNAIGRQGQLLCHLPADLLHFKQITAGHTVLMGERTWLSLPRRPLPNRKNIVLTDIQGKTFEGAESVYSIEEAAAALNPEEETFIIGGGMVYRQFFPFADRLYITHIHHRWDDADTFFPAIEMDQWETVSNERHEADEKNPYPFTFAEYKKKQTVSAIYG